MYVPRRSTLSQSKDEKLVQLFDWMVAKAFVTFARVCYHQEVLSALSSIRKRLPVVRRLGTRCDFRAAVAALVAGEDRRFTCHFGVDTKGLLRAFVVFVCRREVQGASTITQQLVRVVTHDFRRSIRRKAKEMCIVCAVDREFTKPDQAELYLCLGYYGWRMNGLRQALDRLMMSLPLDDVQAARLVARLRYPESATSNVKQTTKIDQRAAYIANQLREGEDRSDCSA